MSLRPKTCSEMVTAHLQSLEKEANTLLRLLPDLSGIAKEARINPFVTKEQILVYIQPH